MVLSVCLSFTNEVILDLQKFQIQPIDTVNPDQLQLLILSASPDNSFERTPCGSENVSAIEVDTVIGGQQLPEFQRSRRRVQLRVKRKMTECWTAKW